MEFKVFGEPKKEEVFFKLVENSPDKIDLVAVDSAGRRMDCGHILSIRPSGIRISAGVSKKLGIMLDETKEYVAITKE